MVDKQYQGILLVLAGVFLIFVYFNSTGGEKLFALLAGIAFILWGILWQR